MILFAQPYSRELEFEPILLKTTGNVPAELARLQNDSGRLHRFLASFEGDDPAEWVRRLAPWRLDGVEGARFECRAEVLRELARPFHFCGGFIRRLAWPPHLCRLAGLLETPDPAPPSPEAPHDATHPPRPAPRS